MRTRTTTLAFIRAITTPRRGIGAATIEALGKYAAGTATAACLLRCSRRGSPSTSTPSNWRACREFAAYHQPSAVPRPREPAAQLEDLLGAIRYEAWLFEHCDTREAESKWSNVRDFVGWLGRKGEEDGKNLLELTQTIALMSMLDKEDPTSTACRWPPCTPQGPGVSACVPGRRRGGPAAAPEQHRRGQGRGKERRLMYVGITRAQRSLNLTWCERRKSNKEFRTCEPSQFIAEMGGDIKMNDRKTAQPVTKEEAKRGWRT